jgi:hypothetical protein
VLLLTTACAHRTHHLAPYSENADLATRLELRAAEACPEQRGAAGLPTQLPPARFTTDGCSAWVDDGWVDCCVEHDILYWCGGTSTQRREADQQLRECVAREHGEGWGRTMYWGVRAGGSAWWPTPWRWGYGWPVFRGYEEAEDADE